MSSIREVEIDRRDEVSEMLGEFIQTIDETHRPKPQMTDRLLSLWSDGNIKILGKFDDEKQILGIVLLSLVSNRLSFVYVHPSKGGLDEIQRHNLERELFDAGFERLKEYESWVTSGGSNFLTKNLVEYALTVGFKQYDLIGMTADRKAIEAVRVPDVPLGYTLEPYDVQWNETIAELIYEIFKGSPSTNGEPDVTSTPERCLALVNDTVHGRYGDFKNGIFSWVLKDCSEIIGVALRTLQSETEALAVIMCLRQSHRGKGLGKLIFVHSLRILLETAPKVNEIQLATMSTNPARHLYRSVGFKEISKHIFYTWADDDYS